MQFNLTAQILAVKHNDWEIADKKGTSHKLQILVKSGLDYQTFSVKFDPKTLNENDLVLGDNANLIMKLEEYKTGLSLSVIGLDY